MHFRFATIEMSFRIFDENKFASKTNPPKQTTDTLSFCARAGAVEILCAGAEIFLPQETSMVNLWMI